MKISHPFRLVLCLVFTIGIGSLGAVFTAPEIPNWYAQLQKPFFNPPSWIFGPVWTLLYTLMGISLYQLWNAPPAKERKPALIFFFVQFTLNFLWSFIFFRLHEILLALFELSLMCGAIIGTIYLARKVKTSAAWLLVPYLCWVTFAGVLNFALWWLNR